MKDFHSLNKRVAEIFLKDPDSVHLREFNWIDDDAAEILSGYGGPELDLYALKVLSDSAARALTNYEGQLCLDEITVDRIRDETIRERLRHVWRRPGSTVGDLESGVGYYAGMTQSEKDIDDMRRASDSAVDRFRKTDLFKKYQGTLNALIPWEEYNSYVPWRP